MSTQIDAVVPGVAVMYGHARIKMLPGSRPWASRPLNWRENITVCQARASAGHSEYQELRRGGDGFAAGYVRDNGAGAHIKDKGERYGEYWNNQHGLLKASGAESFS